MYYVPDGTKKCGYYECEECKEKFLSLETKDRTSCPYCEEDIDLEIGPDEDMKAITDSAKLISIIDGEDEIFKMDSLLSLAITGGNFDWI